VTELLPQLEVTMKAAAGISASHTVGRRPFLPVLVIHNYDTA
jgi:hypothetical protein